MHFLHLEYLSSDIPEMTDSDIGTYSATINRGYKQFCGIRVRRNRAVLQGPKSDVKLHIPDGLVGFISGHMHTDPTPFIHAIPESECLVAPIVDYTTCTEKPCFTNWFKIVIPHCIDNKEDRKHVRVRHGDIYKNIPFSEIPSDDWFFVVRGQDIIIYTKHFSQFICTSCKKVCQAEAKAFIFGSIPSLQYRPIRAAVRLYITSPLYQIQDYNKVCLNI